MLESVAHIDFNYFDCRPVLLPDKPRYLLQSGALSLVESFIELKYFHDVATPDRKAPRWFFMAKCICGPIIGAGSLWHKRAGVATS